MRKALFSFLTSFSSALFFVAADAPQHLLLFLSKPGDKLLRWTRRPQSHGRMPTGMRRTKSRRSYAGACVAQLRRTKPGRRLFLN